MARWWRLAGALALCAAPGCGVDLEIRYGALERLIGEQMFTTEGRRYVRGSKDQKCNHAFLEKPKLAAAGDRLQLNVNFSGRNALDMFGRCVGLGDAFELTILAKPAVHNGTLVFEQFQVNTPRDSFYIRRVRTALAETLNKNFRIDVLQQARRLIETSQTTGPYQQEIRDLRLTGVRVTSDALVLAVDFKVIVQ
jgi:hypothetical protein